MKTSQAVQRHPLFQRSGPLSVLFSVLLGLALFCPPASSASPASSPARSPGPDAEQRLQQLAEQAEAPLYFEEIRSSGLLARPMTVRGTLTYDPVTKQLTKQIESPRPARLSVTETHLVAQVEDGRLRRLPLAQRPDLAALLVAVRALLAGQVDAVMTRFDVALETEVASGEWTLALRPLDAQLAQNLALLEVQGRNDRVHTLQATLDGEVQRMTILPPGSDQAAETTQAIEAAKAAIDDAR